MMTLQQRRDRIARVGELLYGKHWSSRLSEGLGYHRTYISVMLRSQSIPYDFEKHLAEHVRDRIGEMQRSIGKLEKILPELAASEMAAAGADD